MPYFHKSWQSLQISCGVFNLHSNWMHKVLAFTPTQKSAHSRVYLNEVGTFRWKWILKQIKLGRYIMIIIFISKLWSIRIHSINLDFERNEAFYNSVWFFFHLFYFFVSVNTILKTFWKNNKHHVKRQSQKFFQKMINFLSLFLKFIIIYNIIFLHTFLIFFIEPRGHKKK